MHASVCWRRGSCERKEGLAAELAQRMGSPAFISLIRIAQKNKKAIFVLDVRMIIYSIQFNSSIQGMSGKSQLTRRLRSKGACQTVPNIFENEHYRRLLPPEVYKQISEIPSLNCDKISQIEFKQTPSRQRHLRQMKVINTGQMEVQPEEFLVPEEEVEKKKRKSEISVNDFGEQILELDQFLLE